MFERFTRQAREVVIRAQQEARGLGHPCVGTEHLLLTVLSVPDSPGVAALVRRGITAESCLAAVENVVGRGDSGIGEDDAAALKAIGIDLDEVRSRAEDTFGPGALAAPRPEPDPAPRRILPFRRRRNRKETSSGHLPFAPRAKRALERSLREAVALKDRHIGVEHLLLGLLDPTDKLAVGVLRRLGTEPESVREDVLAELRRAA
ncbi:Clp protease N-terminal domain-containing protein [Streptomyces sp. NPDC004647]|uniref:Clp protease N-terminal domain-containing protein n=1 Tax=Streptomyces sp. NPDC004647 TaxID=3154671 RepID=UPI0033A9294C